MLKGFYWKSSQEKIIMHEDYDSIKTAYDIALIKTKDAAPVNCEIFRQTLSKFLQISSLKFSSITSSYRAKNPRETMLDVKERFKVLACTRIYPETFLNKRDSFQTPSCLIRMYEHMFKEL